MTITKKLVSAFFFFILFFGVSIVLPKISLAAASLYFDPSTYTTSQSTDFQVSLQINTDNQSVFGSDAIVTFPSSDLSVKSVTNGNFFTDLQSAPSSGTIEIHGYFSAAYQTKTGSGTMAVITFTPNKNSGSGTVGFTCSGSGNDTDILNSTGQNILTCNSLNQLALNYNNSGTSTGNNNPTNSCGGTCGSNSNCNSGLYCYNGFCRNPNCPNDLSCGCVSTPSPTPSATTKPVATKTPTGTPAVVALATFTPYPSRTPTASVTPKSTARPKINIDLKNLALYGGIGLLILAVIFIIVGALKGKSPPPQINPPTGVEPPPQNEMPLPQNPPVNSPPSTF